jgi:hypothetical protein
LPAQPRANETVEVALIGTQTQTSKELKESVEEKLPWRKPGSLAYIPSSHNQIKAQSHLVEVLSI